MKHRKYFKGPFFIIKLILILGLTSAIVMFLWNALIPQLFNGPQLTYWQAAGLLLLAKILFGSIGRGLGRRTNHRYTDEVWKQKLRAKYEAMTPEEKENFNKKCKSRFIFTYSDDCGESEAAKAEAKEEPRNK
ncbi:MAG TPA: hypothetical protein PK605_01225 [Ignavibacteria bacterium]|nr:hypothetical protein [Ignavibacteria bacterium]HAX48847.1 hypothetical protein [Bacteroidota bacterium]HRE09772.1 hypothetical protein [Ignavibacteria bacterium]HRF65503.1 hypothetical protein [Ignavibacteria bacterium]HRJ03002.1 hypothetical protein [Ignavibacteria bacterium]